MNRLVFGSILLALLAACGAPATTTIDQSAAPDPTQATNNTQLVRSNVPRDGQPNVAEASRAQLVRGNNEFAYDLYHTVTENSDENLIYSPYSISLAFSMLYAGARGNTEAQFADVLYYAPQAEHHPAFNALDQQLTSLDEQPTGQAPSGNPFQLHIANALWGQQGFPWKDAYLDTLAQNYGAGLQVVNFGQPNAVIDQINGWIAEQTEDRITDLVTPDQIDQQTRLVLANAMYFNASWLFPFDQTATEDGPFFLRDGSEVSVPIMHQSGATRVPYMDNDEYQAIVLPYAGQAVDMLIIMPREGRFEAVEAQLGSEMVDQIREQTEEHDVTLTMPRLKFESDLDIAKLLPTMGLTDPFSSADFSGIADRGLFIGAAVHRGTITIHETGTEAAAATVIAMAVSGMEQAEMQINRPFMFAIVERQTGSTLFLGRVLDPTQ